MSLLHMSYELLVSLAYAAGHGKVAREHSSDHKFDFSTTGSHGDVLLQRLQIGVQ